jgi:hypothetical protein
VLLVLLSSPVFRHLTIRRIYHSGERRRVSWCKLTNASEENQQIFTEWFTHQESAGYSSIAVLRTSKRNLVFSNIHRHTYTYSAYIYMHIYAYIYTQTYAHAYAHTFTYTHIYMHVHTHTHTHTHIYIYIYIYSVCECKHMSSMEDSSVANFSESAYHSVSVLSERTSS